MIHFVRLPVKGIVNNIYEMNISIIFIADYVYHFYIQTTKTQILFPSRNWLFFASTFNYLKTDATK